MTLDEVRARLAEITSELEHADDLSTRMVLHQEQASLREQARNLFTATPEGRAMLEQELATLERQLDVLESQQIKKTKVSYGGGGPSGGGLEPVDVYYLRRVHESRNNVADLRKRIEELRARLRPEERRPE
jgi:hypothetical protein